MMLLFRTGFRAMVAVMVDGMLIEVVTECSSELKWFCAAITHCFLSICSLRCLSSFCLCIH